MNEQELIAETIATVKRDGWSTGALYHRQTRTHCILGAIGRARWGAQWDLDCLKKDESSSVYVRLREDPVVDSVVKRVQQLLLTQLDRQEFCEAVGFTESEMGSLAYSHDMVIEWNDHFLHSEEELVEVLEKVQAEVGQQ